MGISSPNDDRWKEIEIISKLDVRKRFPGLVEGVVNFLALSKWGPSGYTVPAPPSVKRATIRRHAVQGGTFVETGTFFGDTSAFARSFSTRVVTIEPSTELFQAATRRFAGSKIPVEVVNAPSEEALPLLLPKLSGDVTFWLDGHYSGGITFEGKHHSPLEYELECIGPHVGRLGNLAILIDDIHACGTNPAYPAIETVLGWAARHGMTWRLEHDILTIRKQNSR